MEKLTHHYNDSINCVEVLPEYLPKGIKIAKNYGCGLRITADFAGFFGKFETTSDKVILDFSPLQNYPNLPELIIEGNFKIDSVLNIEVLYSLEKLSTLSIKKPSKKLQIDISKIPNLVDLRFDFSPNIFNVSKATKLIRLHIWSYKGKDLTEFADLVNLKDFLLVHPSIENLLGIENMMQLEKFEVAYSRKLTDICALQTLLKNHSIKHLAMPQKFWNELNIDNA